MLMSVKKNIVAGVALLLTVQFLSGFSYVNPATNEEELVLVPSQKEIDMGRNLNIKVHEMFDLPVDPLVQERIEAIGTKLAKGTDRKDLIYHFTVLKYKEDDYYNAFAAPGGYIYIFDDLVEVLKSDDNIAGVLAHEMAHIEARHSVKRMQASLGVTALMLLSTQLPKEPGTTSALYNAIGQLMSEYSRGDEQQADELSIKYMDRAGFDPKGVLGALEVLKAVRKKGPYMKYPEYKSHPYISERIAYLRKQVKGETDFDSYINIVSDKDAF